MIPVNRETLTLIATVVCMVGVIFLFREMNRPAPKAVESAPVPDEKAELKTEE